MASDKANDSPKVPIRPASPFISRGSRYPKPANHPDVRCHCDEPSCWFDDGNVVIQAEEILFKVYKGLLSQESDVFKTMFSLPEPQSGSSELYDGSSVVVVQDSAADLQIFIKAIFDHKYLSKQLDCAEVCASLLVTTTKYQAQRLRERIMEPLSDTFPDTLARFDEYVFGGLWAKGFTSWNERVALANAARASGTLILLPSFLLSACLEPIDTTLRSPTLDSSNRDAILAGMPKLSVMARTEVFAVLFSGDRDLSTNCIQPAICHKIRHSMMMETEEQPNVFNPLHRHARSYTRQKQKAPISLCQACHNQLDDLDKRKLYCWEKLPQVFGLGSWDELRRAEKNAASEN